MLILQRSKCNTAYLEEDLVNVKSLSMKDLPPLTSPLGNATSDIT